MLKHRLWLFLLIGMIFSGSLAASTEARTYQLNNRPADDIAAQLRQLYPATLAAITAHHQQLIVRAEPAVLDEMGQLIETMDVAPVQLRITVRTGTNIQGAQQQGGITIQNSQAGVRVQKKTISTQRNREQSLMLQDGQLAHISAGQVRVLPVVVQGGLNPATLYQQVEVRRGFVVQPQVISQQQIELSIMAFDNIPELDSPGFESKALITTRRVKPGEWIQMGSTQTTGNESESGIVYKSGGRHMENQSFQVRVDVL